MLGIVPSSNPVQYQGKLIMLTRENSKNPNFRPPKFFPYVVPLLVRHCSKLSSYAIMQFKGKLMNQTRENKEKPNFGFDFGMFGPNLGSQNFFCGFYLY